MLKSILKLNGVQSIDKKSLSKINGGDGYGFVTCENGDSFQATAESEESVIVGGDRWCQGKGGVSTYDFIDNADDPKLLR